MRFAVSDNDDNGDVIVVDEVEGDVTILSPSVISESVTSMSSSSSAIVSHYVVLSVLFYWQVNSNAGLKPHT